MLMCGIMAPCVAKVRRQRSHLRDSKLGIVSSGKKAEQRAFWAACRQGDERAQWEDVGGIECRMWGKSEQENVGGPKCLALYAIL